MRITGGEFRGRKLESPAGKTTRPTSDRARESIFNILNHAKWRPPNTIYDAKVIDVFSGTGALGLEALSQGAAHAIFVDTDRAAVAACRQNIATFKLEDRTQIMAVSATALPQRPENIAARNLVFLDPPYGKDLGAASLLRLVEKGWLQKNAVCVLEMSKKEPEKIPAGFTVTDERDYGIARVAFMIFSG